MLNTNLSDSKIKYVKKRNQICIKKGWCLRVIMHKTSKCIKVTTTLNSIIHQQAAEQSGICEPALAVLTLLVIGLK